MLHVIYSQVSIIPTKAEAIKGSSKFRCPIPDCRYNKKEGSRVYISKHFNKEHTDHRSWRDVFVKVDAPSIISVAQEEPRRQSDTPEREGGIPEISGSGSGIPCGPGSSGSGSGSGSLQPPPSTSISSATELAWSQANRPPLCASNVQESSPRSSAFIPVPGKVPFEQVSMSPMQCAQQQQQQALLTSLPQPVISLSSPLHFPGSPQYVGSPMPPQQVIPVQPQVIFAGQQGQPVLQQSQQPQQKYKVIQVVVPTRIADQVLNTQQKYQLLPAPPEAQAATLDSRVGPVPTCMPGFLTPTPLPPRPQQLVQVQPHFHHPQLQLAGPAIPPGAAILLPAAATPYPM